MPLVKSKKKPVKYKTKWKIFTKKGTVIRPGDQVPSGIQGWVETVCAGCKIGDTGTTTKYRRKVRVKVLAALLFAATLIFGAASALEAQTAFSKGQVATWTPVTKNVNGGPTTIGGYELAIVLSTSNLNTPGTAPLAVISYGPDAWTGLTIDALLANLPAGTFSIQVRAKNASNVWGAWSLPVTRTYDTSPPEAPPTPTVR
jgi:hypothetical protein